MRALKLYLAVSGHGFGHVAQLAPIVEELYRRHPELEVVVRSALGAAHLRDALGEDISCIPGAPEPNVHMHTALDLDAIRTWADYAAYHGDLAAHIRHEQARIAASGANLVVADVPYVPLAAAANLGIPAVAVSSLNWADVMACYPAGRPAGHRDRILHEIRACYRRARTFIALTPAMTMSGLPHLETVGPVARRSLAGAGSLPAALPAAAGRYLVLATLGGNRGRDEELTLPRSESVHWIVPDAIAPGKRGDVTKAGDTGLRFLDILAGCDAVLTKPGYGTFTEAACHGVPVVYVERPDWPETEALDTWMRSNGEVACIGRCDYERGAFLEILLTILGKPKPSPVAPVGIQQAADRIEALL